jgi:NurA-like 5'-3' nuclease
MQFIYVLDSTYETFARNRPLIRRKIAKLKAKERLDEYRKQWHSFSSEPEGCIVGAEDGSANYKKYKSLVFYAVNALALVFDEGVEEYKYSDVDLLYPYRKVDSRVSLYRAILEMKASLKAIDRADIFLIDGSIFSGLVTSKISEGLNKEERDEVMDLLSDLEKIDSPIASKKISEKIKGDRRVEKIVFLEYLEYLSTMQMLIEKGHHKLIGISKTSSRAELREGMPDMAVYEEVTSISGFSKPLLTPMTKSFPLYQEFFRNFVFTTCYARLEDRKGVLMVEFPREVGEKEIERLLGSIRLTSVMGYPYPLRRAHQKVVISGRDIQRFSAALGITEKTGREVLT